MMNSDLNQSEDSVEDGLSPQLNSGEISLPDAAQVGQLFSAMASSAFTMFGNSSPVIQSLVVEALRQEELLITLSLALKKTRLEMLQLIKDSHLSLDEYWQTHVTARLSQTILSPELVDSLNEASKRLAEACSQMKPLPKSMRSTSSKILVDPQTYRQKRKNKKKIAKITKKKQRRS